MENSKTKGNRGTIPNTIKSWNNVEHMNDLK